MASPNWLSVASHIASARWTNQYYKMQLKGVNMNTIASSLSLAIANYKPVPTIPSQNTTSGGRVSQVSNSSSGSTDSSSNGGRDAALWGLPSILNITTPTGGNIFKSDSDNSGETIGNSGCTVQSTYTPSNLVEVTFPDFDSARANTMRYRKQVGVNVGSWFVLEAWMTPSMFTCAYGTKNSELDFLKGYGSSSKGISSAKARLEKHWDTFITKSDLQEMKTLGINTVRLPIGYWTLGANWTTNTPFSDYGSVYDNAWMYVRRFIKWADDLDIGVLVDVHGAYGSQNGEPISGDSEHGIQFYNGNNRQRTREMLLWLTQEFASVNNVVGIQLLNEPQDNTKLWTWYGNTMDAMRKVNSHAESLPLYFHDAFMTEKGAAFAGNRTDFVVQDMHSYFVFTNSDRSTSAQKHTTNIEGSYQKSLQKLAKTARGNFIIGEWSCALNPQSLTSSSDKTKSTAEFCQAQVESYGKAAAGYFFWSWKMDNCDSNSGWCFRSATKDKMIGDGYNAWGLNGNVTNVASQVAHSIATISLPTTYSNGKLADPLAAETSTCTTTSSSNSNSNSSSNSSSGARNAQVKNSDSGRSSSSSSSRSMTRQHRKSKSRSSSSHTNTKQTNSQHSSSANHHHHRRITHEGFGGPAARAAAHVQHRRAATNSKIQQLGFTDGFVSGQSFAKLLTLSRLGFQNQYLADTLSYYTNNKVFASSDSSYSDQFTPGLESIEKEITSKLKSALNISS
ncbi:hypothetical protein MCUN1_001412 [Malassezia cuniculi]|uniref:Glycoside hydrolase family 5 domain-containing protein n=1 Tax=Malassezia cuniculi TaxID=948313 RepID=A0AAF0EUG7_9BASI|nr:hypothetical protein MCUN1_001412 [Malassezia cuniculi]